MNERIKAVLDLVGRGWYLHPLRPGTKVPATPNGQKDAVNDAGALVAWWETHPDHNIAVACEPSGLYVVDVDMGPGKVGAQTWAALEAEHGRERETFTVRTRSGGLHFYYLMPEGMLLRNTASKLGPDVDTRGNGYVVAPGSVVDGGTYEIIRDVPVAPLPRWIIEKVTRRNLGHDVTLPFAPAGTHRPPATAEDVRARIAQLAGELAAAAPGTRNDTAARLAFMVGGYVGAGQIDEREAVRTLVDAATWADAHDVQTIERQLSEGMNTPRPWEPPYKRHEPPASAAAPGDDHAESHAADERTASVSSWSTDQGQATFLRDRIGGMIYNPGTGWYVWVGTHWRQVTEDYIAGRAQAFYDAQFDRSIERFRSTHDEKWLVLAQAFRKFMSSAKLTAILKSLRSLDGVLVHDADLLDAHPELLNTPAGVVDLRTGHVGRHDPKLLLTKITRGSYRLNYSHADWWQAMTALPAELIPYAQLRFGQAVTGYTPESDDVVFLAGNGSNGKSLWTTDGILAALGDYASLSGEGLIMTRTGGQGGATPERMALRGCRLVLIEELPEGRSLSVAELKRVTGMSRITGRDLYASQTSFLASHTLFITTNYLPTVNETDHGTWRRLCLFEFPYTFKGKGRTLGPRERPGDRGLKARLRGGAQGQHDAIVTWLVDGARRYLGNRDALLDRPPAVARAVDAWRADADRILAYVTERLIPDPDGMIAKADLYWDFTAFLERSGHKPWSQELLFSRFRRHEKTSRAEWRRTNNVEGLSRPPLRAGTMWTSSMPQLEARCRCVTGFRFRTDSDERNDDEG